MKKFYLRLNQMQNITYHLLRLSLVATCIMLALSLAFTFRSTSSSLQSFHHYNVANYLISLGAATLFVATIGSVVLEESSKSKK